MDKERLKEFIETHIDDDTDRLLFQKSKWPDIDMGTAVSTILGHRKLKAKVPSWYRNPALIFPNSLCTEQCSSEFTAEAKVDSIRELVVEDRGVTESGGCLSGLKIADLTGGLGVDSHVFSRHFKEVLYNEMNPVLAEAAKHNFKALGCGNITVRSNMVCDGNAEGASADCNPASPAELLQDFGPDIIYLDPARRAADGKKVFRLEDCRPDILKIKGSLLQIARYIVVKLSPMADIGVVAEALGRQCRRIDVVSSANECKEIVAFLDREHEGECSICAKCSGKAEFIFTKSEEDRAVAVLPDTGLADSVSKSGIPECKDLFLLEPDKALLKAGAFKLPCSRFGLTVLDRSTHCYIASGYGHTADTEYNDDSADRAVLQGLFRLFRIIRILPLDRQGMQEAGREFPMADVTARNIPLGSAELQRRLKVRPSDRYHIFGLKVSFCTRADDSAHPAPRSGNYLFITERL